MNHAERRREPRIVHSFMVRYRAAGATSPKWMLSPLKDFSASGVRFVAEPGLRPGQALELQLMLPMHREPLGVAGRVAWSEPFGDGSLVEQGVEFVGENAETRVVVVEAVAYFLKQQGSSA